MHGVAKDVSLLGQGTIFMKKKKQFTFQTFLPQR
jgi:hypothetical protein